MAFFEGTKEIKYIPTPIPDKPPYTPPIVPTPSSPSGGSIPSIPRDMFRGVVNVTFYKTSSEMERVNKSLTNGITMNISFKDDTSIESPYIEINSLDANLIDYNYCYIEELDRYYFLHITLGVGNIYILQMNVDCLMSFNNDLKNQIAIISKQENSSNANMFLDDGSYVNESKDFLQRTFFNEVDKFLDTPVNILICAGGAKATNGGE